MAKAATSLKKSAAGKGTKPVAASRKPAAATAGRKGTQPARAAPGKKAPAGTRKPPAAGRRAGPAAKRTASRPSAKKKAKDVTRYRCTLCGYVYSQLRGEPHNGIPAGTPFSELPEDYVCPVCGMQGKGKIGKWGFEEWRPTRYICSVCSYVYDEKRGEPHRGIRPGTRFEDLPDDYVCPVCALDPKIRVQFGKVLKQGFEPLNI